MQLTPHKSKRERFEENLRNNNVPEDLVELLSGLESAARKVVALYDLTGGVGTREIHVLARVSKTLSDKYES